MKWYTIEDEFLNWLRTYEKRIPNNYYGPNKFKPFFGVLFEIDDIAYISQISHPKEKHNKLKENLDFVKLYNENKLLAVINLNYMFPVPKRKLIEVKYKYIDKFRTFETDKEREKYITLLKKELKEMNKKNLNEKAKRVYKLKYSNPEHRVSQRSFDFKELEKKCNEYEK